MMVDPIEEANQVCNGCLEECQEDTVYVDGRSYHEECAPARLRDFARWGRCVSCRGNARLLGVECRCCYVDRTGVKVRP